MEETAGSLRRITRRGWSALHLVLIFAVGFGLDLRGRTLRLRTAMVGEDFFTGLGVAMSRGRDVSSADVFPDHWSQPCYPSQPCLLSVIVSHELWRTYFGSSEDILNRFLDRNVHPYR